MKKNKKEFSMKKHRNSVDYGAVEDIHELKYRERGRKSGIIAGTENQINTAGATSSSTRIRE